MQNKAQLLPLILALLFVLAGFCLYGSAGHDDSHITFWASYTLSEFGEILNYNGDRIEQSSSLLLTIITALVAFIFHSDVVVTGYLVTMLAGAGAIMMTATLVKKWGQNNISEKQKYYSDPIFTLVLLASSPAFLLWNTSGMESTLAALCLLWFIVQWGDVLSGKVSLNAKSVTLASLATFCLISVRPEMITLTAGLAFALFIYRRFVSRHINQFKGSISILIFYTTILFCICILTAFRYWYFGSPMPLPVSAKVSSLTMEKLSFGFYYILRYGFANIVFIIGALIACVFVIRQLLNRSKPDFYLLLSACTLLIYCGFIILSGGDWMQMGRFLVPVLPLAALLCTSYLRHSIKNLLYYYLLITAIIGLNLLGNWNALKHESHGTPLWASYHISPEHQQRYSVFEQYNQEHLRDMDAIDTLGNTIDLLIQKGHQPVTHHPITLMSGQSGMVFYYTAKKYFVPHADNKIHFYDTHALIESSFLKCSLINDVARSSQGLYFDFDMFFARQPGLQDSCGIPKPDILYEINDMTRQLPDRMKEQGYTLIHREGGKMIEESSDLPTNTLPAANLVMVKNALLADLQNPELKIIRYYEKPLVRRWP